MQANTIAPQTSALPAPGTYWRARDGRRMKLLEWLSDRAKPTAYLAVINPGYRRRKYTEQGLDGFGSFLMEEADAE